MAGKMFNFDVEFKLGIDSVDQEHQVLVDLLNQVYELIGEGKRDEARKYFNETLSRYVHEHFSHEEAFMEQIGFPQIEEHRKIHENFRNSFEALRPSIESADDTAFRKALNDAFTWIITHIGKTDKRYAQFYHASRPS
ncbi:hemerythrin family protein [Anaerolinea sp.]|uniref:bacteriohemerythrin n=1 Tax=Anaerolinea sp. TaxID=1872519 RepID=UPI002ACD616F|nr:hemerythrin family protein [Anaerolinea sp.]